MTAGSALQRVLGWWGRASASQRRAPATRDLSDTAELVAVALAAGLTVEHALRAVEPHALPGAAVAIRGALTALDLGWSPAEALGRVVAEHPAFAPLASALAQSAESGTAGADAARRVAADAREAWRRHAEARARTAPVRLLFPLVFLVLPAFALLGVAPALLAGPTG